MDNVAQAFAVFVVPPSGGCRPWRHTWQMNRGIEIASDVADGPYSVIMEQVTNGIAVRMAVLYLLGGGREEVEGD